MTIGTAGLGVISSALVTASSHSRSTVIEVVLVMIGVSIAVLSAVNSFLNPGQVTAEYKNDEFELRRLGWAYLAKIERDPTGVVGAYDEFREAALAVLEKQHGGWSGAAPAKPPDKPA